jgi:hypothetical protein
MVTFNYYASQHMHKEKKLLDAQLIINLLYIRQTEWNLQYMLLPPIHNKVSKT